MQNNAVDLCGNAEVGLITKADGGIVLLNGTQIKCGKKIRIWLEQKSVWQPGRVRYSSANGYCFFSEETGEIGLENGMLASADK